MIYLTIVFIINFLLGINKNYLKIFMSTSLTCKVLMVLINQIKIYNSPELLTYALLALPQRQLDLLPQQRGRLLADQYHLCQS